jgi:hypothetical protein
MIQMDLTWRHKGDKPRITHHGFCPGYIMNTAPGKSNFASKSRVYHIKCPFCHGTFAAFHRKNTFNKLKSHLLECERLGDDDFLAKQVAVPRDFDTGIIFPYTEFEWPIATSSKRMCAITDVLGRFKFDNDTWLMIRLRSTNGVWYCPENIADLYVCDDTRIVPSWQIEMNLGNYRASIYSLPGYRPWLEIE